jgi:uncharacterized protein (TIGR01777 family)
VKVLIAGGSGFLGRHLAGSLLADGHQVWVLSRNPALSGQPVGVQVALWDGRTVSGWGHIASEVDAIVNLTGSTIGRWPWTPARKRSFISSRVDSGRAMVEAVRKADPRPKVLLQASGGNYYGPHGNEPVTEGMSPGDDFPARLCVEWEASSRPVEALGVRRVVTRTGIVLSRDAYILKLMALPSRLYFGGRFGDGRQGIGWIHLRDEIRAFRFLLENENVSGDYNLGAPGPVSNAEFMRVLARTIQRPYWFHTPAFLLRLGLGEMSTMLLDGWYLQPERLLRAGFKFEFETIETAFRDIWL